MTKGFAVDLSYKLEVMKTSVSKVEVACYNMRVRGSERSEGWIMDIKEDSTRGERDQDDSGRGKRRRTD